MLSLAPLRAVSMGPDKAEKNGVVHVVSINGTGGKIWYCRMLVTKEAGRSETLLTPVQRTHQ